jgi:hypothetical protein
VSDIDTVVVDSLKALDPEWPIREEKRTFDGGARGCSARMTRVARAGHSIHLVAGT